MNSRRRNSLAANPLLIGAVTTLITIVAVYLSYNANNGLPFTPTYDVNVELPEAAGLQTSNEVRIGGARVGTVDSIMARQNPATGKVTAVIGLKLEKAVEPLPADTTAIVQSQSALGLKYLQLNRGTSSRPLQAGATLPLSQAREPVVLLDLFNMFNEPTRNATQRSVNTFGDALAGRGLGLNNTIAMLPSLVKKGIPVLRNLAAPQTALRQLFISLDRAAAETAPVAQQNANAFSDLDTFFTALAHAAPSIEQTIAGGPPALRQAIHSLPYEAPFVENATEFMRLLHPSASALRTTAAPLGHALAVGAVNIRAATAFNDQLASTTPALVQFSKNPIVTLGIEELTRTAQVGNPLFAGLAPAQTTCNYITLFFRNLASLFSQGNGVGTLARFQVVLSPLGPNAEGGPSSAPANGPSEALPGSPPVENNHLHSNPYPYVAGPGQPHVCEAGNETYVPGRTVIGHVPTNPGTGHDVTTRKQNLLGAEYPSATLKDLGVGATSHGKAKPHKKTSTKKSKQKGKQG